MTATAPLSPPSTTAPIAVTPKEAAHILSIRLSHLYKLMRAGELHSFHCGGARRILLTSIEAYVARQVAASAGGWQQIAPSRSRGRPRSKPETSQGEPFKPDA
jgi:excisionase family DNA binding protein